MPLNFTYDPKTAQYRNDKGRFVSAKEVRGAIDKYIDNSTDKAKAMFQALRDGQVNVKELQLQGERQCQYLEPQSGTICMEKTTAPPGFCAEERLQQPLCSAAIQQQYNLYFIFSNIPTSQLALPHYGIYAFIAVHHCCQPGGGKSLPDFKHYYRSRLPGW